MRQRDVVGQVFVDFRSTLAVVAVALVLCGLPALAMAETMYRWRDPSGSINFSNRSNLVPAGAQAEVTHLPTLGLATTRPIAPGGEPAGGGESAVVENDPANCGAPDSSGLVDAVVRSIPARMTQRIGGQDPELALFVAGEPVSYPAGAVLQVVPGQDWNAASTGALDPGAVAYPASGGCPGIPLDRYPVSTGQSAAPAEGRCYDFAAATAEVEIALQHNENVGQAFVVAARRFAEVANRGGVFHAVGTSVTLPQWLAQVNAAKNTEFADEMDQFARELRVAREEIELAAETVGCLEN